jgi:hypothetical protein
MNTEAPKEGYKVECPRDTCRSKNIKRIVSYNDGSDNVDNLSHYHLECPECGIHFLQWGCEPEKVKKAFGNNWRQYV